MYGKHITPLSWVEKALIIIIALSSVLFNEKQIVIFVDVDYY